MKTIFEWEKKKPATPAPTKSTTTAQESVPEEKTGETNNNETRPIAGHMGLFTDICEYPDNIDFVNQEKGEQIVLFLRQHFATNFSWIASSVIALFIPPLIGIILGFFDVEFVAVPTGLIVVVTMFYYLVIVGYAFTSFLSWFYNIGIVTKKRIVDIDYSSILHKNIASVHLSDVVDTDFTQKGIFSGFYNYGTLYIQTEGLKPNFEFTAAPRPVHVSNVIHEMLARTPRSKEKRHP